jgi:hypothetical protein
MEAVAEHAGFFAAHGIWCVSDGGPLIPMLAFERPGGKREMIRFVMDRLDAEEPGSRPPSAPAPRSATAPCAKDDS